MKFEVISPTPISVAFRDLPNRTVFKKKDHWESGNADTWIKLDGEPRWCTQGSFLDVFGERTSLIAPNTEVIVIGTLELAG